MMYTHSHIHAQSHTRTHTHVRTHTHAQTHTHAHTHTHVADTPAGSRTTSAFVKEMYQQREQTETERKE